MKLTREQQCPSASGKITGSERAVADSNDEILTVPELAERLRVGTSWVYSHADILGAYRLGKYVRFSWKRVLGRLEQSLGG
jgi:hypothetical protein